MTPAALSTMSLPALLAFVRLGGRQMPESVADAFTWSRAFGEAVSRHPVDAYAAALVVLQACLPEQCVKSFGAPI